MNGHSKLIGGILLVSGTTIGAGMLALPVSTGLAGFIPSIFLLVVFWLYMTYTAFLMLEVNLWMGPHTNLISMAKNTLGTIGEAISWLTYLFLLYSLTTAYVAGSGPIVIDIVETLTGYHMPSWAGSIPLLLIFGFFVYKGTKSVDYVNRLLMFGLVAAYCLLTIFLTPHVHADLLLHANPQYLLMAVSIVATSFGFHIIIPSLTTYFERDVSRIKQAIFIGSAIPLVVYIIWELLCLGIVPVDGKLGLAEGYAKGSNGAYLLSELLGTSVIAQVARIFAFFAIVTSFLGVSLSLTDFLADGLKIRKTRGGRILLYMMVFLPPLVFTLTNPRAFLSALEYAGAYGVVILLGLMPALMVWAGRYRLHFTSTFTVPGGKIALICVILLSLFVISLELANKMGMINFLNP
jgi:tyrosine-specific transport protein